MTTDFTPRRIGILSDTHDQAQRTRAAVAALAAAGAEALIHCGDLTTLEVVAECAALPCYYVFGNCDDDHHGLRQMMESTGGTCLGKGGLITLCGRRLGVTHGDSDRELHRLLALAPDFLFSGHTHVLRDEQVGATRRINPGALHRASTWTVALVDLVTSHVTVMQISNAQMHS